MTEGEEQVVQAAKLPIAGRVRSISLIAFVKLSFVYARSGKYAAVCL